jgi:hypothetical protein
MSDIDINIDINDDDDDDDVPMLVDPNDTKIIPVTILT